MSRSIFALILMISSLFFIAPSVTAQKCRIKIKSPTNDTEVGRRGVVNGTAHIPTDKYLWIVARKRGFYGWWPQGNGPVEIKKHQWEVAIHYGVEREYGKFEILAVVVDEKGHAEFEQWVREAPNKNYPPMPLPTTIETCPLKRRIVEKVREN